MSFHSISKATDDVLKAYDIKWAKFQSSILKDVYDSVCLKEGEMPDKDEFNSLLAIQFEKYYMEELRVERNKRLTDCDWVVNNDVELNDDDKKLWSDYRKELRDLPNNVQLGDDTNIQKLFPDVPKQNVISPVVIPVKVEVIEINVEDKEEDKSQDGEKEEEPKNVIIEDKKEDEEGGRFN